MVCHSTFTRPRNTKKGEHHNNIPQSGKKERQKEDEVTEKVSMPNKVYQLSCFIEYLFARERETMLPH